MAQPIPQELAEIVALTPDYQNRDSIDWEFYDRLAEEQGFTRGGIIVAWNDLVDGAALFLSCLMRNPGFHNGNIVDAASNAFSGYKRETVEDIIALAKTMVSAASLTDIERIEHNLTINLSNFINLPELYHGTGSRALAGIMKHDALLSEYELNKLGESIDTGEGWRQRKPWLHGIVCLTQDPARALDHHAYIDGIRYLDDFPVVLGFSKAQIDGLGDYNDVYSFHIDIEPHEVCVKEKLPIRCATHVFAPYKRMHDIMEFCNEFDLQYVPLEMLQKDCNSRCYVLRYDFAA